MTPAVLTCAQTGIGGSNVATTTIGLAMGGHARTGTEDTLLLPGTVAEVEEALDLPARRTNA